MATLPEGFSLTHDPLLGVAALRSARSKGCSLLQDQYETLFAHSQKGIDFLEKYGQFIRDRCQIELEYAGKLRWVTNLSPSSSLYNFM